MRISHFIRTALPALCLTVLFQAGAACAALLPSIQFGTLPVAEDGETWEMAIPIDGTVVALESRDERLEIRPAQVDGGAWLVFSARTPGPASALLEVLDVGGRVRKILVAADAVPAAAFEQLLLRGHVPGSAIERFVRRPGTPMGALHMPGAAHSNASPQWRGWTRLSVRLPAGVAEADGTLEVDGEPLAVHASLLESITVQGSYLLASNFAPVRVRALDERLQNGRMSARIGVLGQIRDEWYLRSLDAIPDGPTVTFSPVGLNAVAPAGAPDDPAFLARIQHLGGEATEERFLALMPGRAAIVHPLQGPLVRYEDNSLLRLGAARASRVDRNKVYAITGNGGGECSSRASALGA